MIFNRLKFSNQCVSGLRVQWRVRIILHGQSLLPGTHLISPIRSEDAAQAGQTHLDKEVMAYRSGHTMDLPDQRDGLKWKLVDWSSYRTVHIARNQRIH